MVTIPIKLGDVVTTRAIAWEMEKDEKFALFVRNIIRKHAKRNWGDLCEEDWKLNDLYADKEGAQLLSVYYYHGEKIWIESYVGHSTCVLYPQEHYELWRFRTSESPSRFLEITNPYKH